MTKPDRLLLDIALNESRPSQQSDEISSNEQKIGECYTMKQVAELLQCSERTVFNMRERDPGLKFFKHKGGRALRIPRADFESWFQSHVKTLGESDGSN